MKNLSILENRKYLLYYKFFVYPISDTSPCIRLNETMISVKILYIEKKVYFQIFYLIYQ